MLNVLLVSFPRTASIILLGRNVSTVKMVILEMPLKVPAGSALVHIQTGTVKAWKKNQAGEGRRKRGKKIEWERERKSQSSNSATLGI